MKKIMLVLLAGSLLTFNSCTKSGPQGPKGATGNANVIGENSFNINPSDWSFSNNVYYVQVSDNNITTAVADYGLVEVYRYYTNGWSNLPDINGITSMVYNFAPNIVTISVLNSNGSDPGNPGTVTFRIVVVPSSLRQAHPNTNWKNYNETMAVLKADKATPAAQ